MIKENTTNSVLRVIARWFVGLVFLFSSFTKGVDPLGTAFKVEEYMTAWSFGGLSFEWALPLAPLLSMTLITMEFLVGVMLLTGSFRKLTAWILLLMMAFFTVTTLYDAISNKVSDCGCFGDAVKLTNWKTFWKNIVLDVPTLFIFLTRRWPRKKKTERDILIALAAIAAMVIFGLYNINNEPVVDFRPWKVGNRMIDNLEEGLQEVNIATYSNSVTGEKVEFDVSKQWKEYSYILYDSTDTWQRDTIITQSPYEVHADGFYIEDVDGLLTDEDGTDLTFKLIAAKERPVMIATIHHLQDVNERGVKAINEVKRLANERNFEFALLVYLPEDEDSIKNDDSKLVTMTRWLYDNKLMADGEIKFYFGDEKAIETMLRSNPGFILMSNAEVKGKWHYRNVNKIKDYPFNVRLKD